MPLISTLKEQKNGRYRPLGLPGLSDKRHQPLNHLLRILSGMGYDGANVIRRDGTIERVSFRRDDQRTDMRIMLDEMPLSSILEDLATACADRGRAEAGHLDGVTSDRWQLMAKAINRAATSALDFGI